MFDQLGALTPQSPWIPLLLGGGAAGMAVLIAISVWAKVARRVAERPTSRELIESLREGPRAGSRDETHAVAADAVDTARRLASQLDNKARRLEVLIARADERIAALAAGGAPAADGPPPLEAEPAAAVGAGGNVNGGPRQLDPLTRQVYGHADAGLSPVEIARRLDEQVGKVELILALRQP